jgi:general secretion pathway protein I
MNQTLSVLNCGRERGSVTRSALGGQRAAGYAFAPGLRTGCGSQTRGPNRNAGFSLVEVIVAIVILSIALVGLAHGITTSLSSSKESEMQTAASMYAAGLIENLRAEGDLADGQSEGDCGAEMPLYRWTESVTGAGVDGLHEVEVTIQSARSGQAIYELRTLLFEPPADTSDTKKSSDSKSKKKRAAK